MLSVRSRGVRVVTAMFLCALCLLAAPTRGDVIVSSDFSDSVRRYDFSGNYLGDFVPPGGGGLNSPQGITVGPDGNVYVSSGQTNQVLRYDGRTGEFLGEFAIVPVPFYLTFGPDGNLYVSSGGSGRVLKFDGTTGEPLGIAAIGGGLQVPDGLSFGPDGSLYVSEFSNAAGVTGLKRFDPSNGTFQGNVVGPPGGMLEHRFSADRSQVFISSFTTSTIRRYDVLTGAFLGNFISGPELAGPVGQLLLPDGSLLVSSWSNSRILRYDATTGAFLGVFSQGLGLGGPNNLVVLPEPAGLAGLAVVLLVARRSRSAILAA